MECGAEDRSRAAFGNYCLLLQQPPPTKTRACPMSQRVYIFVGSLSP